MRIKILILAAVIIGNSFSFLDGNSPSQGNTSSAHGSGHASISHGGSEPEPKKETYRTDFCQRVDAQLPQKASFNLPLDSPTRSNFSYDVRITHQPMYSYQKSIPDAYQATVRDINNMSADIQIVLYNYLEGALLPQFESYLSSSPAMIALNLDNLHFPKADSLYLSQEDKSSLNSLMPNLNESLQILKAEIFAILQCDGWFDVKLTELQKQRISTAIVDYFIYNCPEVYKQRLDESLCSSIVTYNRQVELEQFANHKDYWWTRCRIIAIPRFNGNCIQVARYNMCGDRRGAQALVDQYKHKPELHCTIKAISEEAKGIYQAKLSRQKAVAHSPQLKSALLFVEKKKIAVALPVESVDEFKNNHQDVSEQQIAMQETIVETAQQSAVAHNFSSSVFDKKICDEGDNWVHNAHIFNIQTHIVAAKKSIEIARICFSFVIEKACVIGGELYSYTGEIITDIPGYIDKHVQMVRELVDYIKEYPNFIEEFASHLETPEKFEEYIKNGGYEHPLTTLTKHMKSMSADDWCKGAVHFVIDGVIFTGTGYAAKRGVRSGRTLAKAAVVRSQKTAKWVQSITRAPKKVSFAATAEGTLHRVPVEQLESTVVSSAEKSLVTTAEKNAVKASSRIDSSRWGFWSDLSKTIKNGKEYALINGRLYTRHAIDRMTPKAYGVAAGGTKGRGVPTFLIEEVIEKGAVASEKLINGTKRIMKTIDNISVILEDNIVVTVLYKGK